MKSKLLIYRPLSFRKSLIAIALLFQFVAVAQVTFTDSNLPIIIITTDINPDTGLPTEIPDDPKVPASMKIIYHEDESRNYLTDQNNPEFLDYDGRLKIEIRGSSSQALPKKQYGWTTYENDNTTKKNVSLLGMPSENDWILNGLAFDPSLLRDYFAYNLTRQLGQYTTRTKYCEVIINGEYKGLYVLQEKIKDDGNRVNIEEIEDTDNTQPNLSGGYITKADKTTGGDPVAWIMDSYAGTSDFIHEMPKPGDVTPEQDAYIHSIFQSLENTTGQNNAAVSNGYPSVIDIPTFVDFMIINELASNADAYQISTFFHKDRGGKLRAGPVWDMNLTFGNDLFMFGLDRSHTNVWQFSNGDNEGPKFFTDLFNNTAYKCYMSRRWNELTGAGQPLNEAVMSAYIDEIVAEISEAAVREQLTWGTVPNHTLEIANMKTWISQRIAWMTNNIGSFNACDDIVTPSLVIAKINYNPGTSTEFPVANDQEFIEIKNTGSATVDLTGVYLRELGISYQFPINASVNAGQSIFLARSPETFQMKHGIAAFGQYQRNMSNNSQALVLADGFGNIIDSVTYDDESPWPSADGNGSYLTLIDVNLDNSLASSWTASDDVELLAAEAFTATGFTIYPNPVNNWVTITTSVEINEVAVYDIYGKQLVSLKVNTDKVDVDLSALSQGVYVLKASGTQGVHTQKIIKK
jgi:hypothetical protein